MKQINNNFLSFLGLTSSLVLISFLIFTKTDKETKQNIFNISGTLITASFALAQNNTQDK